MTREEIRIMPAGKEIDDLVAEKIMTHRGLDYEDFGVPNFSTDICAAWEVIGRFNRSEWDIDISSDTEDEGKIWGVDFIKWSEEPIGSTAFGSGSDVSLPLAICRAALLAVIGENV